jgi:hypothetical protein
LTPFRVALERVHESHFFYYNVWQALLINPPLSQTRAHDHNVTYNTQTIDPVEHLSDMLWATFGPGATANGGGGGVGVGGGGGGGGGDEAYKEWESVWSEVASRVATDSRVEDWTGKLPVSSEVLNCSLFCVCLFLLLLFWRSRLRACIFCFRSLTLIHTFLSITYLPSSFP